MPATLHSGDHPTLAAVLWHNQTEPNQYDLPASTVRLRDDCVDTPVNIRTVHPVTKNMEVFVLYVQHMKIGTTDWSTYWWRRDERREESREERTHSYKHTHTHTYRQNSSGLILFSVISQENIHKSQSLNPNTDTLFVWVYVCVCVCVYVALCVHVCVCAHSTASHCLK